MIRSRSFWVGVGDPLCCHRTKLDLEEIEKQYRREDR
jgi:hypothetical protein